MIRGIRYTSLGPPSGYGVAAKAYMLAFRELGIPVSWVPMVLGDSWGLRYEPGLDDVTIDRDLAAICNLEIDYDTVVVHSVPAWMPLWAAREPGKRLVGCTVWETDRLPPEWPSMLASMDRIIVPTAWNREVFRASGYKGPLDVVPHIAPSIPPVTPLRVPGLSPGDFVFYTIGGWTTRKAMDLTVTAFLRAFRSDEGAVLLIKTAWRDGDRDILGLKIFPTRARVWELQARLRSRGRVIVLDDYYDEAAMAALHARGDCYVSLTHAEGWGLGAFEAAAAGKPVIITGFGGPVEFLPADLSCLVDFRMCQAVGRGFERRVYRGEGRWAMPSVDDGARLMRWVFDQREEARRRGRLLRDHVRREFSAARVMQHYIDAIESTPEGSGRV